MRFCLDRGSHPVRTRRRLRTHPPGELIFFIDRSVGKHSVADPLRAAGLHVEVHDDHFPADAQDQDWLPVVGNRGWFVITCDARIRYRRLEITAARNARVGMFVIVSKNLTGSQIAEILLKALNRMRRFIKRHNLPFVAKIYRNGSIKEIEL